MPGLISHSRSRRSADLTWIGTRARPPACTHAAGPTIADARTVPPCTPRMWFCWTTGMSCEAVAKVLYSSRFSSGGLLQFRLAHLHRVLRVERLPPASDRLRDVFPGRHRAWRQRVVRRLVTGGPCQDCGHAQLRADASNSPLSATDVLYASPGVSRFPDCHRRKPPMSIRAPQTRKPISQ
jgi:hypothetical protein